MKEMVEVIGKGDYETSEIRIPRPASERCQGEL
jgi:hypothetical protein